MDPKTQRYYSQNAQEVFARYDSSSGGIEKYFPQAFPEKGTILDIGTGSGRDVRRLVEEGHDAYGLEPSDEFRALTIQKYPHLAHRMLRGHLPDDLSALDRKFNGIVCSAVLMHIPKEHLFDSLFALKRILNRNGRVLISIPLDREDLDSRRRDPHGRLFTDITAEYLELLFERIGFRPLQKWTDPDSLGRKGVSWATLLFQLEDKSRIRPIDQIEGVLNRDRKVATYKLALFRALCEIAMTSFQKARWFPDGRVGVPVEDVAEKWISYYWPLVDAPGFIPQIQGEHASCSHPIAFRKHLRELAALYQKAGGLSGFTVDLRGGTLNDQAAVNVKRLLSSLKQTIIKGPVTYAGGSLASGKLFDYGPKTKMIMVDSGIWKELSLMSHWILDALILRWAELTTRLSKDRIDQNTILDHILSGEVLLILRGSVG
jgi:SAM-dependent methyltransferase